MRDGRDAISPRAAPFVAQIRPIAFTRGTGDGTANPLAVGRLIERHARLAGTPFAAPSVQSDQLSGALDRRYYLPAVTSVHRVEQPSHGACGNVAEHPNGLH